MKVFIRQKAFFVFAASDLHDIFGDLPNPFNILQVLRDLARSRNSPKSWHFSLLALLDIFETL
jgi:hypothetical protein